MDMIVIIIITYKSSLWLSGRNQDLNCNKHILVPVAGTPTQLTWESLSSQPFAQVEDLQVILSGGVVV